MAEFVEYCSIDIGGTTGLKLIAAEGSAQAISVTLSALAKLEDGGEKLAEFVEYCFRNRRDGRNALMVVAQEGSASDISNSACALKQIKRYLHDFIEICKNVKRRDCGTNALKYVASNGMDLDMMLLINTTYIDSVLYHTDMDSEIIDRGIKILKSNTASNLDKIIILESLARVQESSPEENKYRINDLLSSGGSNKLRNDVWKEYSDGSLEFDCPLEKIRNRLPEENKVGLSRCKQLVRVEIINACIKVMEARCSKDENAKEREDYHHGLLMDAIELRAEINNLIKHGPKSHNVRETDDKATYAKSEPAHTQASSHSAEYRRDCAPKNCGPTKWRQEANKCTSGESKLGVQSCSAAQEYSGKRNKRGSFPRF